MSPNDNLLLSCQMCKKVSVSTWTDFAPFCGQKMSYCWFAIFKMSIFWPAGSFFLNSLSGQH